MNASLLLSLTLLCALHLGACTKDFGVFDFGAVDGGGTHSAAVKGEGAADAAVSALDGGSNTGAADSGRAQPDAQPIEVAPADAGLSQQSDAAAPTVGTNDAGGTDAAVTVLDAAVAADGGSIPVDPKVAACAQVWSSNTALPTSQCSTCACAMCADPVNACLASGPALEVMQCSAVFACAVAHDCKDWDCYCATANCRAPAESGDGPCVAEMEAAAGGSRARVMSIRQAGDPTEPLVRAMNAIGCVLGLHANSPGGPKVGECDATCP